MKRLMRTQFVYLFACALFVTDYASGMAKLVGELGGATAKEVEERLTSKLLSEGIEEGTAKQIAKDLFAGLKEGTYVSKELAQGFGETLAKRGFKFKTGKIALPENLTEAIKGIAQARKEVFEGFEKKTYRQFNGFGEFDEAAFKDLGVDFKNVLEKNGVNIGKSAEELAKYKTAIDKFPDNTRQLYAKKIELETKFKSAEKNLIDARSAKIGESELTKLKNAYDAALKDFEKTSADLATSLKDHSTSVKNQRIKEQKESLTSSDSKKVQESIQETKKLEVEEKNVQAQIKTQGRKALQENIESFQKQLNGDGPVGVLQKGKETVKDIKSFFGKGEVDELAKLKNQLKNPDVKAEPLEAAKIRQQIRALEKSEMTKVRTQRGLYGEQAAINNDIKTLNQIIDGKISIEEAVEKGALEGKTLQELYDEALIAKDEIKAKKIDGYIKDIETTSGVKARSVKYLKALKELEEAAALEKLGVDIKAAKFEADALGKATDKAANDVKALQTKLKTAAEGITAAKQGISEAHAKLYQIEENIALLDEPVTWTKARAWETLANLKQTFFGFAFAGGGMIASYVLFLAKGDPLVRLMKKPYRFANMWLMMPPQFINNDDPEGSLFLYTGLNYVGPSPDVELQVYSGTKLDQTRAYFVEHRGKGSEAVTDTSKHLGLSGSYNGTMLSLRTGDLFVSSGDPADPKNPVMPLVSATKGEKGLRQEFQSLEGLVRRGSATLANLMSVKENEKEFKAGGAYPALSVLPEDQYPPLLNNSITNVIDKPVSFQNRAKVTKFTAMQVIGVPSKQLRAMMKGLGSKITIPDTLFESGTYPFGLLGTYVYQTSDTKLAQQMRDGLGYKQFVDYVIFLDGNGKQVPLFEPQQGGLYNFFMYLKNKDIVYMKSLLDDAVYQAASLASRARPVGTKLDQASANAYKNVGKKLSEENAWEKDLNAQLKAVTEFVAAAYKGGEYVVGTHVLTSPQGWAQKGISIYQVKNALASGTVDDYVIGLKKIMKDGKQTTVVAQLPQDSSAIFQYFSLVTSRCYDPLLQPWKEPAYPKIYYAIESNGKLSYNVDQAKLKNDVSNPLISGTTDQFTMFMDADINPIDMSKLGTDITDKRVQIALTKMLPYYAGPDSKMVTTPEVTQKITAAWKAWKAYFKDNVFDSVTRQPRKQFEVGTYAFYNAGVNNLNNVYITASNATDVTAGFNVYSSKKYPGEYLALLTTWSPTTKATDLRFKLGAYSGEQYAIGITTGTVYDGKAEGNSVFKYDTQDVWNSLQAFYTKNKVDLSKIPTITVQKIAEAVADAEQEERAQECGTTWGSWRLYLNSRDAATHQYIYGDISQATINQYSNKTSAEIEKGLVADWYVCGEYATDAQGKPQKNPDGSYIFVYGKPFSKDTTKLLMSLTSLIAYNDKREPVLWNAGKVTAQMSNRMIKADEARAGFATLMDQVAKTAKVSAQSLRLYTVVKDKLGLYLRQLEGEQREIAEAKAAQEKRTPLLDVTVQELLLAPVVPTAPGMLPRNLRKAQNGKYYQVIPQKPEDTDVIYITSYNATTENNDSKMAYVYEVAPAAANARKIERGRGFAITGEGLELLRANAGVEVGSDGKQSLTVGFESPNLRIDHLLALDATAVSDYQKKLGEITQKVETLRDLYREGTITPEQNEELKKARAQMKAYTSAIDAANVIAQATASKQFNKQISAARGIYASSKATIEQIYLDANAMVFVAKIKDGDESYYLDLQNGFVYDVTTGRARVLPVFIGTLRTVGNHVLVNTKDAQNRALFQTDAVGLKRFVFQNPTIKGSLAAMGVQTDKIKVKDENNVFYNEYTFVASLNYNNATQDVKITVKESPLDDNGYPTSKTIYTVSQDSQEIGTYTYDPKQHYAPLQYYDTRSSAGDLGFVKEDAQENHWVAYLWNGDEKRVFTHMLYHNQIVPLNPAGGGTYTGTVYGVQIATDPNTQEDSLVVDPTKTHTITVKQEAKKLPAGLTEDMVTVLDESKEYDFHYVTELIQDIGEFVRDVIRLTPIADVNGLVRLVAVIPASTIGTKLSSTNTRNVQADSIAKIKAMLDKADIYPTRDNKKLLYVLQAKDLEDGMYTGFKVDLVTGIVYNALGVPFAGITMVELINILDKLGVRVMFNDKQEAYLIYHGF